jgi:hypothetical protein
MPVPAASPGATRGDVFALVVGICIWVLRVAASALLARDEYPP